MPLNTEEGDHMGSRKGRRKSHLQKKIKKNGSVIMCLVSANPELGTVSN